jgi:hypothetical protein
MKLLIAIIALATSASAFAVHGTLVSEKIKDKLKYCKYSNDVTVIMKDYDFCPKANG